MKNTRHHILLLHTAGGKLQKEPWLMKHKKNRNPRKQNTVPFQEINTGLHVHLFHPRCQYLANWMNPHLDCSLQPMSPAQLMKARTPSVCSTCGWVRESQHSQTDECPCWTFMWHVQNWQMLRSSRRCSWMRSLHQKRNGRSNSTKAPENKCAPDEFMTMVSIMWKKIFTPRFKDTAKSTTC